MSRPTPRSLPTALGAAVVAVALASGAARAQSLAYVEASSELDDGKPASFVWNLVDGKDTTAWCSKPSPTTERFVYGFQKIVTVKELEIVIGAVKGPGELDKRRHRARQVVVIDNKMERILPLKDDAALQKVKLDPPAKGKMIVVEVREMYKGEPGTPVCIGELHLKGAGVGTGGDMATQVRALPTPARRMLHSWVDEVSAPERSLVFSVDGTFRYEYRPLMEGKPVTLTGKWTAGHKSLTLETLGKSFTLRKQLTQIDGDEGKTEQLSLSGDGPHSSLNASFVIAPPVME